MIMGMHSGTFNIWSIIEKVFGLAMISGVDKAFEYIPAFMSRWRRGNNTNNEVSLIKSNNTQIDEDKTTFKSNVRYSHQYNTDKQVGDSAIMHVVDHILLYMSNMTNINLLSYKFTQYIISEKRIIHVEDDIYFKYNSCTDDPTTGRLDTISFDLLSKNHSTKYILQFVEKCSNIYKTSVNSQFNNNIFYFDQIIKNEKNKNKRECDVFNMFTYSPFTTTRSFDNIFFTDKQHILNRINTFVHDIEFYRRVGIPHTLGFMLYGTPGNGKTSFIKALAKYTNRHVVNIKLTENTTSTKFKNLFYSSNLMVDEPLSMQPITVANIPIDRRIYVLEDIDCGDNSVVLQRTAESKVEPKAETKAEPKVNPNQSSEPVWAQSTKIKSPNLEIMDDMQNNDKLDLQTILNCLDGTLEVPGRIIIATSNFPEKIDNALLRPGRFDCVIHFNKADDAIIRSAIKNFSPKTNIDLIHPAKFEQYKWSIAELIQILCRDMNDIEHAIGVIDNANPVDEFKFRA